MKLIECVPNFSEGRDREKIQAITKEIEASEQITLLDVDPGESTNRTVVTFIGTPEGVLEAAFKAIKKASEVLDMSKHSGAHSRMGATDVCPFIPVSGVTMEDCIQLAHRLGERVAEELGIPIYLYEEAAQKPDRKNLATIRAGEYEGLEEKLKNPEWAPDYGEARFNPKAGATVIGAREFLIAYNINLNSRDRKHANHIALNLRERGRAKRDQQGKIVRDKSGKAINVPGKFKDVKAVGWFVDDYRIAQISINFTNYKVSPPHLVFDETIKEAEAIGCRVTGSELVGLIPKDAMLMAGRYYLEKQGKSLGIPEEDLISIATVSLGLNDVSPFDPQKKIIEYQFKEVDNSLIDLNLREFANELSIDSPAPGGGSTAALCGALSASLTAMVSNLTVGRKGYEDVQAQVKELAVKAQALKDELLQAIDLDTIAFNKVMSAGRMPKKTDKQKAERAKTIESASQEATLVPFRVLETCVDALQLANEVALCGNKNSISDAGVAALSAQTGAEGAYYNVIINLPGILDQGFVADMKSRASALKQKAVDTGNGVRSLIEQQ
ncbi:MAG: glutamate formimidoyltransferase, partial [Candidatus Aminicenantes bacterium]|nr:glutamate formimidoyltransferase [Candidatus Aminicenantes bacterium]